MKKYILTIVIGFLCIHSSAQIVHTYSSEGNTINTQPQIDRFQINDKPMLAFHKGMITIKLKKSVGDYSKQNRNVLFNIPSLDEKVNKFKVNLLEKRFRYNPEKMKRSSVDLSRIYRVEFPESIPVTQVVREFSKDPNIEYAEPIPIPQPMDVPNDPMYGDLYHLPQIMAEEAWEIHKGEDGTEEVVIAIVDDGADWDHEDLVDNIWQNLGEDFDGDGKTLVFIGGEWIFDPDDENGVDDDENGYIDDFIGWNLFTNSNDPQSTGSHGTHCAGLAGGTTNNNTGIASISWNLKIMPVQASIPGFSIALGYDGIIYAAENGADVISNSWGGEFYSYASHEAITYATALGSIIVAAGGNDNKFINTYPADYPGVISIASVSNNDHKAWYSNYGPNIGISVPSIEILSTTPDNTYETSGGTSAATPIAAGLLGLVKSYHPDWTADQVITQVLGTAEDIDVINPGYENLLGAGRINAFYALDSNNVTLQQEISVDLMYAEFHDTDSDNILYPGDTASLSFKLRNYNFGVGCDNANFTLITEDPSIIILDDSCSADIPADDFFTLDSVFKFAINNADSTYLARFHLITTANVEITWGDTNTFELLVAPGGLLVYQGEGSGNSFSGDYINEFLVEQGHQVFYTSHFPSSLNGFDAVFLSYGNYGVLLDEGVIMTYEMTESIADYLVDGGYLYAECSSLFGGAQFFGYPNTQEFMELFGVDTSEYPLAQNSINLLTGLSGSICENLAFAGSTQSPDWYIDIMTPNDNGIAAFEEDEYGTVAVQGEGEYGQRTFCFAYALAHLEDGTQGTREELLDNIVEWLLLGVGADEIISKPDRPEIAIYPNPFINSTTLSYALDKPSIVTVSIFNPQGQLVEKIEQQQLKGEQQVQWNAEGLPAGMYYYRIQAGSYIGSGKMILLD